MKRTRLWSRLTLQNALRVLLLVAVLVGGVTMVRGQSALDGFDPNADGTVHAVAVQPDGKIIIGGDFTAVSLNGGNGLPRVARNRVARLNPDGSLDIGFNPNANDTVFSIMVQADGKILVGGKFTSVSPTGAAVTRNRIARFNPDGTLDADFNPDASGPVYVIAEQADGKILAGGQFANIGGQTRNHLARLDATTGLADSLDPNVNGNIFALVVQADGQIVAGGNFTTIGGQTRNHLARLDATTGLADSFDPNANFYVESIAVQPDGKVLAGGAFTSIGGQTRNHITRLSADGTLDPGFDPNADADVLSIVVQTDGQILLGGVFTSIGDFGGRARKRLARLDATGALDSLFDPYANNTVLCIAVQSDGKILAGGDFTVIGGEFPGIDDGVFRNRMARLEADGKVDQTLNLSMVGSYVVATAVQPDGKILIGGRFTQVLGVARSNLARLNSDGTLDANFLANTDGDVYSIAVQSDGKILVGGDFGTIKLSTHNWFARLSDSGTPDGTFSNPNADGVVRAIAVQSDGKILVGGSFTTIGGQTRNSLARLIANGSADFVFDPNVSGTVYSIAVQSDGKILAGGSFGAVGGVTRNSLARLDATTGLADSLDPNANGDIFALAVQADGKIVAGGNFTTIGGQTHNHLARLDPTTGLADSFDPAANDTVYSIALQADGKVLAGGLFVAIGGQTRPHLARLDPTSGLADSFDPAADDTVYSIALQADGKVLAGGLFTAIGGPSRNRFARLSNDTAALSSLIVTRNTITLTRAGSAPQFTHVSFGSDYEFDGIYGFVGNGIPQGSGYTLTGLNFPTGQNFLIRSRGYFRTGNLNGSETTEYKTRNVFLGKLELVWTNLAGGDWNVASNWNPNFVPGTNDNAIISVSATVTVSSPAECLGLTLGSLSSSPTLTGSGTLTLHGASTWTAGTMSGSGRTVIESGASLGITNTGVHSLASRTLENGGTVLWTDAEDLSLNNNAVVTNRLGALFEVRNASTIGFLSNPCRFDNAGTFRKSVNSGTTIFSSGLVFNNSGTVEIQTGTLLCTGSFTNDGVVSLLSGTTNRLQGGGLATGPFTAPASAMVEWTFGNFTLNPGAQLNGAGLYKINGGTVTGNTDLTAGNLDLISGTLTGPSTVTIGSAMNWTGGTMSGSGRTIIPQGVMLNAAISSGATLNTRTLDNGGTVLLTGAGDLSLNNNGVVTNRPGALFEVRNASAVGFLSNPCRFDNAGTFRKSVNSGTTVFASGLVFNNSGTVEIQTGMLLCTGSFTNDGAVNLSAGTTNRLQGGGSASGAFATPANAMVEWNSGTFTLNPGAQLNGAGLYRINGALVIANADLTVKNLDLFIGTLDGPSRVTVANQMNWTGGTMSGSGRTIIPVGVTLNLAVPSVVSLATRTLENGGTVLWTGAGNLGLSTGAVITNRAGALFHLQNAAPLGFLSVGRFDNVGTFRKSVNPGLTQVGIPFNNSGTVDIQTGTLLCTGSFTNDGAVNLSAGTTNRLQGGGSASGTFATPANAMMEWNSGTFTLNPGAQLNGAGLYRINGALVIANADLTVKNLDLFAGTLDGPSTVTIASAMNWTGGMMSGSGRTIIPVGVTLNLAVPSVASLATRTLENVGTVLWTGAGNLGLSTGAVITNRAGALFHLQNAAPLGFLSVGRFDNAGTFRKSVNPGLTQVGIPFNNSGTVDIQTGILAANNGYVSSGNALLNCALGGTTAGTSYGQLQVSGTVTLNGGLSVNLLPGFTPAVNDTFTVVTADSRSGTFVSFFYPSNQVTMQLSNTASSVVLRVTNVFTAISQPILLQPELSGSNIKLTWTATSNVTYRLESNPAVNSTNWSAIPGDVTTLSNTASKLDARTSSNRFYRVHVLP